MFSGASSTKCPTIRTGGVADGEMARWFAVSPQPYRVWRRCGGVISGEIGQPGGGRAGPRCITHTLSNRP